MGGTKGLVMNRIYDKLRLDEESNSPRSRANREKSHPPEMGPDGFLPDPSIYPHPVFGALYAGSGSVYFGMNL